MNNTTDNLAGRRSLHRLVRHLDLFSGIGGFALACRIVGRIKTVGFCEQDKYCQRVLAKHWPDVPICDDIHKMKGNDYGPIDIITGGFPCQPYSLAGKRRGNEDDRALWPQMLRVIREARPAWVLGENVPGIITLALDSVLADLEGERYACEAFIVPACAVNAKHRRDRVWIVGHSTSTRIQRDGACGQQKPFVYAESPLPVCTSCNLGGNSGEQNIGKEKTKEHNPSNEKLPDWAGGDMGQPWPITEFERSSEREIERDFRGVAHGVSRRVDRLRALGNAIVPQVAAEIIRCMMRVDCLTNA